MILRVTNKTASSLNLPAPYGTLKGLETRIFTTTINELEQTRSTILNWNTIGLISFSAELTVDDLDTWLRVTNKTALPVNLPKPYGAVKGFDTLIVKTTVSQLQSANDALTTLVTNNYITFNVGTSAQDIDVQYLLGYNIPSLIPVLGDVTGTTTNTKVVKIQNRSVSATLPTEGQTLVYTSGSWVPGLVLGATTARIVVGNALAGDTVADCTYLDPGDGTGIALALLAAGSSSEKDIYIRSGTYTLTASNSLLLIPTRVNVTGAGVGLTFIVGTSVSGVSMTMLSCTAGLATAPTVVRGLSLISPAPVAGVSVPTNYGMVTVESYCEFQDIYLTMNGSGSISHPCAQGFVHQTGSQLQGLKFTDVYVKSASMTLNSVEVRGWSILAPSSTVSAATVPNTWTRCGFYASGTEQTANPARGWFLSLDKLVVVDCFAEKSNGILIDHIVNGSLVGPTIQNFRADARGLTVSQQIYAVHVVWDSTGVGSVNNTNITGISLFGDANVKGYVYGVDYPSYVIRMGSKNNGPGPTTVSNVFVQAQSYCTEAGAGSISISGEANNLSNAIVDAQLGLVGDVISDVATNGSTRDITFKVICRNMVIGSDTRFSNHRIIGSRISGDLSIGANAVDTMLSGSQWGTLTNLSASTRDLTSTDQPKTFILGLGS